MTANSLPALRSELEGTQKCLREQIAKRNAAEFDWHPQLAGGPLDRIVEAQAAVALLERRVAALQSQITSIESETSKTVHASNNTP